MNIIIVYIRVFVCVQYASDAKSHPHYRLLDIRLRPRKAPALGNALYAPDPNRKSLAKTAIRHRGLDH